MQRHALLPALCIATALVAYAGMPLRAQTFCDSARACTGNALSFTGGVYDYVDIFTTPQLQSIDTTRAMTVDLWMFAARRAGVTQYVAGVWGPREDRDDRWALSISPDDSLIFEVSAAATNLGDFDNTRLSTPVRYGVWMHVAATWNGATGTIELFVDGIRTGTARNTTNPALALRPTQSYLQLGSVNGVSNDSLRLANFTGILDEFRLWNRIVPPDELRCNARAALAGDEAGLIFYHRFNETGGDVLCDASRYRSRGNRRGALAFVPSTRQVDATVFTTPPDITQQIACTSDTTFTLTVVDTSTCGASVTLALTGPDAGSFRLDRTSLTLARNTPETVRVTARFVTTGRITAAVVVTPRNTCNPETVIPITLDRSTSLASAPTAIRFDTLYGCANKPHIDTTVRICNTSGAPLDVSALGALNPRFIISPAGWSAPATLAPGECRDISIRFAPADTGAFADTLRIATSDPCPGSGYIPLSGVRRLAVTSTIDSAIFDNPALPCRRSLNLASEFFLRNRLGENIVVDTIIFSNPVFYTTTRMPLTLRPDIATRAYVRFRSSVEGVYHDTARVLIRFRDCVIEKRIVLRGRIVGVNLVPSDTLLAFGNIIVGTSTQRSVDIGNLGIDTRSVFTYLSSGRAFSFAGGARYSLAPAGTRTITVTFRPTAPGTFRDTLFFQDVGCLVQRMVLLEGTGVDGSLRFRPATLEASGVVSCRCRLDTVTVENTTGAPITLRSVAITGSTRFTFDAPAPTPNEVLAPGARRVYVVRYCPAGQQDFTTEVADIVVTSDGPDPVLRLLVRGTVVEPKLFVDVLTNYGDVEVGDVSRRVIDVVNVSTVPVRVDSLGGIPPAWTIVSTAPPLGSTLAYRDTMRVTVDFSPPSNTNYSGNIIAYSNEPCAISASGQVSGRGIIVPLFVPWTTVVFREATRCDSVLRVVGLVNDGSVPIRVDSISITGVDAAAFSWRGRTFAGPVPRDVPPKFADSIDILYFPARSANVTSNAVMRIGATTRLGHEVFRINLVGGRIRQFIPNITRLAFPSTPVRVTSAPLTVNLQNPSYLDTLFVEAVRFLPDNGVFRLLTPPPLRVAPRATVPLRVEFTPLAARTYAARIELTTRVGCLEYDTSLSVDGEGYTPPFLISLCIDTSAVVNSGDTLRLPVLLNRAIPQNPLDISMLVRFPRRALQYLGTEAVYTTTPVRDTLRSDGVKLSLRANWNVGSGPIAWLSFRAATWDSSLYWIETDSIAFSSDSTLALALFGGGCTSDVTILPRCGVDRIGTAASGFELGLPYPNPAREVAAVEFGLREDTHVRVELVDGAGRTVAVAADGLYANGRYVASFDTSPLAPGVYHVLMRASWFSATRPIVVLR